MSMEEQKKKIENKITGFGKQSNYYVSTTPDKG